MPKHKECPYCEAELEEDENGYYDCDDCGYTDEPPSAYQEMRQSGAPKLPGLE